MEADLATKQAGKAEPVFSVASTSRTAITYQYHQYENCEIESVVTGRLRHHIRTSAAKRASYDYYEQQYARRYNMGIRAGMMIDFTPGKPFSPQHRFQVKIDNDLLPDGSRINMYEGGERSAI